jgi:3',5'-cyclic AMP phosphodiesterase CpdA
MTLLVQISDPHFGTEQPEVVDALRRFVHAQSPQLAIVSGDITQRARRRQFRLARAFIDSLDVPGLLVIPGNHDIPLFNVAARLLRPYANHMREFGELEPVFASDDVLAIAVNTTRNYRHTDGEISAAQVEQVALRLGQAHAQQLRIVVTHQPVCVIRDQDRPDLVRGHAYAIHRWAEAGADLILGGHIHLPYLCALTSQYDNLARPIWALQAGAAVSCRIRHEAGNSVNLIRYEANALRRCQVERWDYLPAQHAFECMETHMLDCGGEEHDR